MGNSLRCCLACVLPCGALDLIRIVHLSTGVVRRILILSPDSELKRGTIYFLIPSSSLSEKKRSSENPKKSSKRVKKCGDSPISDSDRYLTEILSEKKVSLRDHRSRHVGVWRPHLQSISED
ncbi:hypothetical protein Acr_15g0003250 [Actinidia rufa]|uniref:Uncharacterized protein n=1 Tax=Actinidia rufa TaxID=165716 RepID=A0A7J0FSM4_9ERIC|nr:hypothetical protein Acr_15g0003250 [Actinidia rufa]